MTMHTRNSCKAVHSLWVNISVRWVCSSMVFSVKGCFEADSSTGGARMFSESCGTGIGDIMVASLASVETFVVDDMAAKN